MNRLAFSTLGCPGWSVPQVIDGVARYGYDGVELRLIDGEIIEPDMAQAERTRIGKSFAEAGVPICCVGSSIRLAELANAAANETTVRAFLQIAHDWQAPAIRIFGGPWPDDATPEQVFDGIAEQLNRLTPEAERLGVVITIETHDTFSSAATVAELLSRVSSSAFGALWDVHHTYRVGESPDEALDALAGRVPHVHVKDARRNDAARTGWDLLPIGEGEVPVTECLAALDRRGYDGWISVEWEKKWHPELAEPEIALPQHSAYLRKRGNSG